MNHPHPLPSPFYLWLTAFTLCIAVALIADWGLP